MLPFEFGIAGFGFNRMTNHPIALIYRFKLLPFSETFILNQSESLKK